jgi:hypothetical protein
MSKRSLFGMSVVLGLAVSLALIADPVSGYKIDAISAATRFDSEGILSGDGRQVVISGPYTCDRREGMAHFQVSVPQNSTLAQTRGETVEPQPCTDQEENFVIEAIPVPDDSPAFEEGPALVCGFSQTFRQRGIFRQKVTRGSEQWCSFATLVKE